MKKLLLLLCCSAVVLTASAQDDDLYFVPSKKSSKNTTSPERYETPSRHNEVQEGEQTYDNWADGRGNGNWDVDAYNRRTPHTESADTTEVDSVADIEGIASGDYTARLVRFHSPHAGVIVSSPYYSDIVDVWVDPWYYSSWYSPWGWYDPWYYSWHSAYWHHCWGWGWSYYPYSWSWGWGWCDPWYHHHHHWHPTWGGVHNNYFAGNIGPRGGFVGRYGRGGAYTSSRPSQLHLGQFTQYGCTRYDKQQSRVGQLVLSPLAQLRTEWHTHARQRAARKRFARQNIHTEFYHAPQQFWKHKKQFQKYKEHPLHHAHNNHHTFYDHTLQHRQRRR